MVSPCASKSSGTFIPTVNWVLRGISCWISWSLKWECNSLYLHCIKVNWELRIESTFIRCLTKRNSRVEESDRWWLQKAVKYSGADFIFLKYPHGVDRIWWVPRSIFEPRNVKNSARLFNIGDKWTEEWNTGRVCGELIDNETRDVEYVPMLCLFDSKVNTTPESGGNGVDSASVEEEVHGTMDVNDNQRLLPVCWLLHFPGDFISEGYLTGRFIVAHFLYPCASSGPVECAARNEGIWRYDPEPVERMWMILFYLRN